MLRIVLAVIVLTTLTACETTKGLGRDIQNVGEKVDRVFLSSTHLNDRVDFNLPSILVQ